MKYPYTPSNMNMAQRYSKYCSVRNKILVEKRIPTNPKSRRDDIFVNPFQGDHMSDIAYLRHADLCRKIYFYQYQIPNGIELKQLQFNYL